ncbi:NUDIX hydrolase [Salipaludibacillus keqinensis]|uniref:NUDIX hydrolase n=1 Tax=Salipaludibacillus keqinensis TaxID=2045207 RepID=A0A323TQZ4_9BACI|nr:NUDIX domain-containing protein [Salipaludibacillus keqinensis]PYZ94943.1 NUDIX hydrolase [Salipaludibacillus keqinensis]
MIFNKLLGTKLNNENENKINYREAVRAVIVQNDHILLIQSNMGDYKFPGGGVEKNESHIDGLVREVAEESGYKNCTVNEKLGVVKERRKDEYDNQAYFQMNSHYYLCELTDEEQVAQQLDDYEADQEFTPHWLPINEAIEANEKSLQQFKQNRWIYRENFVLRELLNRRDGSCG